MIACSESCAYTSDIFSPKEGEHKSDFLLRVGVSYQKWCDEWNEGLDEPSIVSNLFMKYMESYRRCVGAVKRWNTWLLEIEGSKWLGAFKLTGKTNYVTEGCHRIDTLYGGALTPDELEWRRVNQLFLMTEGGHAMSLDEVNELQMLWIKGAVASPQFSVACKRSRYLMASKASAQEVFGSKTRKSIPPSFESDVCTLTELLLKGNLYPKESDEKRVFDDHFWWDLVRPSTSKVGTEKARSRETVPEAEHVLPLFQMLSNTEVVNDYDEFELDETMDDNADVSVVSSTMGSVASVVHDLSVEDQLDSENVR